MVITGLVEHEVHVARSVRVPLKLLQQLTDRSVVRNGIWHWHNRLEPEHAILITVHDRTSIWTTSVCVLDIVEAMGVRLPDIDLYTLDGLAGRILDGAKNQAWLAVGVVRDEAAVLLMHGFMRVEGSQHGAFGAGRGLRVVDAVNKQRETDNI